MQKGPTQRSKNRATLRVVLALVVLVMAQGLSAFHGHAHAHDSDHGLLDCEICRLSQREETGILPELPALKAPEKISWRIEREDLDALIIARRFLAFVGRAPPLA